MVRFSADSNLLALRRVGPQRGEFEDTGLPHHADDDHHAEQQKDDVPIDSGLAGIENIAGFDHPQGDDDRPATRCGS